jgi:Leucine-rich repeat (LRR) protein
MRTLAALVMALGLAGKPLESLTLDADGLRTLAPLAGMTTLAKLKLSIGKTTDAGALAGRTGLRELSLSGGALPGSALFARLTQLRELGLYDNGLRELTGLAGLAQLTRLMVGAQPVTDLAPIGALAKLERLSLIRLPATVLPPLATKKLVEANFTGTVFRALVPLASSPELWRVTLAKETDPQAVAALRARLPKLQIGFDQGGGFD